MLKDSFKGFYNPAEDALKEAWNSDETIFVFDTNVLLNLYGYAEQTRNDFFELLKSINEKVWIPYHVGLEYQRRRLEVIRDEKGIFNKISDNLDKIEKVFKGDFEQLALKRRFPKLHENTEKLSKEIHKSINAYKKSVSYWDEKQPCVRSHDSIREEINRLTEGKLGPAPESQEWLDRLYAEGENRYANKIPPGFKDKAKEKADDRYFFYDDLKYDRQYGDLILWQQLIDKASTGDIKNVIFVTDDSKEDWWFILDSRGKKQIGLHANLQNEIYRKSKIDLFQMYNTSSFLENGKEFLDVGVHESSIKDANTYWIQAVARASRKLSLELESKEDEVEAIKEYLNAYRKRDKYQSFIDDITMEDSNDELEELRDKIKRKNDFIKFVNLKDINSKWNLYDNDLDDNDSDD